MLVELTKKEYELVVKTRKDELDYMSRAEKKRNCKHNFVCIGYGHDDDCYECVLCGTTKWQ